MRRRSARKIPYRWRVVTIVVKDTPGAECEREPTMNHISTLEEAVDEDKTAADDVEHGRHTAPLVKDPGDYHGKHRSGEATRAA